MACNSLTLLARECGKNTKTGVRDEVYLLAYTDADVISGTTEVFAVSSGNTISNINLASGGTKFVKYGAVKEQNSIKEDYTYNDNGTYDIQKTLTFTLTNVGSVAAKTAVENLVAAPVIALVKLKTAYGLSLVLMVNFKLKLLQVKFQVLQMVG
jgi:hypothetical protein